MAVFGAVAVMLAVGWQFGISSTEAVYSETEVALEKAIAGSRNCSDWICWQAGLRMVLCYDEEGNPWYGDENRCGEDTCS